MTNVDTLSLLYAKIKRLCQVKLQAVWVKIEIVLSYKKDTCILFLGLLILTATYFAIYSPAVSGANFSSTFWQRSGVAVKLKVGVISSKFHLMVV